MTNKILIDRIQDIYDWLDEQIAAGIDYNTCNGCGQCCEYEKYGHRIYITNLEALYLQAGLNMVGIKNASDGKCPYMQNNKCSVRDYRFGACRIFFCKADTDIQQQLSEEFLRKIKSLCQEFAIDYQYKNLPEMLSI